MHMIKKVIRVDCDLSFSKARTCMAFSHTACIICSFYAGLLRHSPTINVLAKCLRMIGIVLC
jgi:hypothetical protein